ncbi:tripartite tricarboxylate transporter substrate binding protein [Arthrobacter monumenti]
MQMLKQGKGGSVPNSRRNLRKRALRVTGTAAAAVSLLGLTACGSGGGGGSEFPSETIEMIIPYSAGGSTDVSVRGMAAIAEDTCGTNIIASNQTGSAGAVGFTATANAAPDGYTVGATATELAYLYKLGITDVNPEDVKGVMRYALNPHVYFVPADSPYKTMEELIAAAEDGETINAATSGTGSVYHLAAAGLAVEAGVKDSFRYLPFEGGASAVQATIGGQADLTVVVLSEAIGQVESGRLRPLAVAGEERLDAIPDTPTLSEIGIDWTSASHLGLAVPAETEDATVQKLDSCLHEAIESEEFQQSMAEQNLTLDYLPPKEFADYLNGLTEQYSKVIDEVGIGAE